MIWSLETDGFRKSYTDVSEIKGIPKYRLTTQPGNPHGFNVAPFRETVQVRKSKLLAKDLDEHGNVAADAFISNEFARGNIDVN